MLPNGSAKEGAPTAAECRHLVSLYNERRYVELEQTSLMHISRDPESGFSWKVLAMALRFQGKEALHAFQKAAEFLPNDAEAHNNLGSILRELGKFDAAVASCRRALEIKTDFAEAHNNLGNALRSLGQFDAAAASCRRALEIDPDLVGAHYNFGNILKSVGKCDAAAASYRRALAIRPNFAGANNNLGVVLHDLGQFDAAEASYRRALEIKPDYAEAHNNLGVVLHDLGQFDAAEASYRRALEIKPGYAEAHSNLLFSLSHNAEIDPEVLFAEHKRFGECFEGPLRGKWRQHANSGEPERCLRVGFVSGDLYSHAVAQIIEPVLAHLAPSSNLSLHAYYNNYVEDGATRDLQGLLAHWHRIAGLTDDAVAEKIRKDGIDILVDLSGHTFRNRLLVFARKPAPIQAAWIGYPHTTGLAAVTVTVARDMPSEIVATEPPPTTMINGIPLHAYDRFTRVGKAAISCFASKNTAMREVLDGLVSDRRWAAVTAYAVFHAEGGRLGKRRLWRDALALERLRQEADFLPEGIAAEDFSRLIATVDPNGHRASCVGL